jgi:hypothetical protein
MPGSGEQVNGADAPCAPPAPGKAAEVKQITAVSPSNGTPFKKLFLSGAS